MSTGGRFGAMFTDTRGIGLTVSCVALAVLRRDVCGEVDAIDLFGT
jgi:hypothetical protein